jgi:hypothetical protein
MRGHIGTILERFWRLDRDEARAIPCRKERTWWRLCDLASPTTSATVIAELLRTILGSVLILPSAALCRLRNDRGEVTASARTLETGRFLVTRMQHLRAAAAGHRSGNVRQLPRQTAADYPDAGRCGLRRRFP